MHFPEYTYRLVYGALFAAGSLCVAQSLTTIWGLWLLAFVLFTVLQFAIAEFCHLAIKIGAKWASKAALPITSLLFVTTCHGFGWIDLPHAESMGQLFLYLIYLVFVALALKRSEKPLIDIIALFLGSIYLALPLAAFFNLINNCGSDFQMRQWLAIYAVAVTKMTDVGAWFFGKLWGRSPLGALSPHKTIEGIWGGLLIGCLTGLTLTYFQPQQQHCLRSLLLSLPLHLAVSAIAQVGDLLESLLKRAAQVRHSSSLPGLGGALDLLDSLFLTAPFLYLWHQL